MNLSNIAISNNKSADNRCIISGISKSEGIHLIQNIDLTEERGTLLSTLLSLLSHIKF